jgi:hypothetical protein
MTPKSKKQNGQQQEADLRKQEAAAVGVGYCGATSHTTHPRKQEAVVAGAGYCGATSHTTHPEIATSCPVAPTSRLVALALAAASCSSSVTPKSKKQNGQQQEADLRKQEAAAAGVKERGNVNSLHDGISEAGGIARRRCDHRHPWMHRSQKQLLG